MGCKWLIVTRNVYVSQMSMAKYLINYYSLNSGDNTS